MLYIAKKNRMGDRILGYFNLRVFTNQPIKKLNIYFKYLAHIYLFSHFLPFLAIKNSFNSKSIVIHPEVQGKAVFLASVAFVHLKGNRKECQY